MQNDINSGISNRHRTFFGRANLSSMCKSDYSRLASMRKKCFIWHKLVTQVYVLETLFEIKCKKLKKILASWI